MSGGLYDFKHTGADIDHAVALAQNPPHNFTEAPVGTIIMYFGAVADLPQAWKVCDGSNNTPDLTDLFVHGTNTQGQMEQNGGHKDTILPSHAHDVPAHTHTMTHAHTGTVAGAGAHEHTQVVYGSGKANGSNRPSGFALVKVVPNLSAKTAHGAHTHTVAVATHSGNVSTVPAVEVSQSPSADTVGKNLPPFFTLIYIKRVA